MLTENRVAETDNTKMTAAWWDDFLIKCRNFTETIVIENVLSDQDCDEMTSMTLGAVREICNRQICDYDFRFYLGAESMDDEYLRNKIFPFPPMPGESLTGWANRVFPGLKFGIILNYGEKFSPLLAETIGRYANPLLEKIGIPVNGTCITIFIGNYGYTPLGIHQDHKGENVVHFHLGPGGKVMYNWEADDFKKRGGHQNYMDVEAMLPYATSFPFKKGDLFYMPWDKFHIGHSDELSIGVTLWFNNITRKKMINKLISAIQLQYVDQDDDTITRPERNLATLQGFAEIEALFKMDEHISSLPVGDFFKYNYQEYMRALFSNAGWRSRPLSLEQETGYDENDFEHLRKQWIQRIAPFTLHHKISTDGGRLFIYCRASKVEINYHPALIQIIEQLNTGGCFLVEDLIAGLVKEWPEEAGLYFLSLLYNKRGIQIVKR